MSNISKVVLKYADGNTSIQKKKMDSKKIIDALQKGVVTVVFKKLDTGEIRTMPAYFKYNDIHS